MALRGGAYSKKQDKTILQKNHCRGEDVAHGGQNEGREEIKEDSKGNGDRQRRQCLAEDAQEQESEAKPRDAGDGAGNDGDPVCQRSPPHQHTVEDEVTKTKLDSLGL